MKLFQKWRARRAAEREAVEAEKLKEVESRREAIRNEREAIMSSLVQAGFTPLNRWTADLEFKSAATWASIDNKLYKVTFNHKGGMSIELVK